MKRQRKPVNKKIILGITGSFGSGKSTVAAFFKRYGAEIIDADRIAHQLIRPGTQAYKKIAKVFGKGILKKDSSINRKELSRIVFENKKLLASLNALIHPAVISIMRKRLRASENGIVVLDAPLLLEAGLKDWVDKLIVVTLGRDEQLSRIGKKTGLSKDQICARIRHQISLSRKVRNADFVIDNNGSRANTGKQVAGIWRRLKQGV